MMLIIPLVVGALAGGPLTPHVLLTFIAAFFAYLARHPLVLIARAGGQRQRIAAGTLPWLLIYGAVAAISGLGVVLAGRYWLLLAIAALAVVPLGLNLFLATRRAEMSLAGELLGIGGLSLGAPAMFYVAAGVLQPQALGLWLLTFLYFGGTVFYIKLKVRIHSRQSAPGSAVERLLIAKATIIYHLGVVILTALLVGSGLAPLLAPLAYIPATCKAVQGALHWQRPVNVRRLGVIEVVHSLLFAVLLLAAYV